MKSQLLYNVSASLVCLMLGVFPASAQQIAKNDPATRPQVMESYGKLPLTFEANQGQTDRSVKFLSRGSGYTLFLTEDCAVLSLHGKKTNAALRMRLVGANAHAAVSGMDSLPGKSDYFTGTDPKQWRTNVPTYASVKYTGVYPGIDLVYHGNQRLLEYDFVVAPGADLRVIDLRFEGTKKLSVNGEGSLVLGIGENEVIEHAPVVYQEISGQRHTVSGKYVLRGSGRVGFSVGTYDESRPLLIDPTLIYSTFLGGNSGDNVSAMAIDASGNAYVTGQSGSTNFPTTAGVFLPTSYGSFGFVTKLNASGTALVYSTYLVGDYFASGSAITVDAEGNAYVTGFTQSSNFPTTPRAFQTTLNGGRNAFVTKVNATGSALIFSTYLGGSNSDEGRGIAIDALRNVYVTGRSMSPNFPTTPRAFQPKGPSNYSVFVTKLNATGSALVYSTRIGSSNGESEANSIAIDASGNAFVTGMAATGFPTTPGAFRQTFGDSWSAFVAKLNNTGSALVYSTYLGGDIGTGFPWDNCGNSIQVDGAGNAYIAGYTDTSDFPTTPGAVQRAYGGGEVDAFVSELNAVGSALVYSTYLGGSGVDMGFGIALDDSGVYITGFTSSNNFPTTGDAFQRVDLGGGGAFVSKLKRDGSALLYSTYLGGSGQDDGYGISVDASGNAFVAGWTSSLGFPTTPDAFQTIFGGGTNDIFVSKLHIGNSVPGPATTAVLSGLKGNNDWYLGPVTVTLSANDLDSLVCAIYYQIDSSALTRYAGPILIAEEGTHSIVFYSTDNAGRQESPHGRMIGIDITKPASHIAVLPVTENSPNFSVKWSATSSDVYDCSIYVSDNGGPYTEWLSHVMAPQAYYPGFVGHSYDFYSIAMDVAGNYENRKTAAEATTTVPQMPGDVNGDGKINCTDLAIVKASMGKSASQTGFDPRADVNHDGVVNVLDLAIVSQKLIPGTACP